MTIEDVIRRIGEIGIVPVVRAATAEEATRAVEAICAGGIPIVEITMTVPNATSVIRHVVREHGNAALIGAGTVTSAEQAEQWGHQIKPYNKEAQLWKFLLEINCYT